MASLPIFHDCGDCLIQSDDTWILTTGITLLDGGRTLVILHNDTVHKFTTDEWRAFVSGQQTRADLTPADVLLNPRKVEG